MPHKQKIPVEEKVKIVQDCLSNKIRATPQKGFVNVSHYTDEAIF